MERLKKEFVKFYLKTGESSVSNNLTNKLHRKAIKFKRNIRFLSKHIKFVRNKS